jgi:FKBP-type peptidyl-prolyl cis-trans isomerase
MQLIVEIRRSIMIAKNGYIKNRRSSRPVTPLQLSSRKRLSLSLFDILLLLCIWIALNTTDTTAFIVVASRKQSNWTGRISSSSSSSSNNNDYSKSKANLCAIVVARNGLQYEDVEIGTGRRVLPGDAILCYYVGTYQQKQQPVKPAYGRTTTTKSIIFDETSPGEPAEFVVGRGQVIKGWDLAIVGDRSLDIPPMKIGGDRKLWIPADLAYGKQSMGSIPANQDLEFQIMILNAQPTGGVSTETQIKGITGLMTFLVIMTIVANFIAQNYIHWF